MAFALTGGALFVAFAAMLAAFAQGLSGFAFNLVALGLWLHVLPPQIAGPLGIVCSLITQCFNLIHFHQRKMSWSLLWPFIVTGLIGAPIGVLLLDYAEPRPFRLAMGVFLLGYSSYMLFGPKHVVTFGGRVADAIVGFIGGVMGGLAGLSGAVPTAWCMLRGWSKDVARGVYQPFNFGVQVVALIVLIGSGTLTAEFANYVLWSVPAMVIGVWIGLRLYARVSETQFRRLVLWLLLASGVSLLW